MKIKISRETLLKALQKVGNIVNTRNTLPVLSNILFEAADGKLKLTGTDLEIRMETVVDAEVIESGETTLPAKKMLTLVSKFRDEFIEIESGDNFHSTIKCGTASIMLLGLNPADYPKKDEVKFIRSFSMKQADMAVIIERIAYAASLEDSRKVLQGILFSVRDGKFTAVATDGKRLALCEKVFEELPEGSEGDIIITQKAANELKRLLEKEGEVAINIAENQVVFEVGASVITSKLIEGNYPNYRQVIPASFKQTVTVSCESVIYALELICVTLAESGSPKVSLTFKSDSMLFETNSNIGEGRESVPIQYDGEEMSASFNSNFFLDPFKHIQVDNVFIKVNDVMSPIAIESGDGFLYVIMPMRNK